ncbi:hypothetical protein L3X38_004691 [Prunus dulcis]|uniref:Transposable element protein n=1 Tax=Prunus dulcis TaxID=3755 RepID=A0AAD5F3H8_PRUDU|nr:hypothetical protein L3X38_004691 [Prunus dulcis]
MEPTEPTSLGETIELAETTSLAELAELTSLAEPEYAIFTNATESIPHASLIVPNQAPLDIPEYVMDLLADTGILGCKLDETTIVENHKLGVYVDYMPTNKGRYQRLVKRLIYLSLTCLDIAYVVSVASQFIHSPSEDHMVAVMRILSYLKFSHGRSLLFKKNGHFDLEGYTDAYYAGNITDRHSTSGYFTFIGGNLVTWHSKKQNVVSRSSAESEYKGIAQGVCKILWLRWLFAEIGFSSKAATKLHCDSQSASEIANNLVQHD